MNINFNAFLQDSQAKNDFQRLMELCNSYGLNQEETNQIITDFKNGSFCNDQSLDQSFQQSLRQRDGTNRSAIDFDESENHHEQQEQNTIQYYESQKNSSHLRSGHGNIEEYSFKDGRNSNNPQTNRDKQDFEEDSGQHHIMFAHPSEKRLKKKNGYQQHFKQEESIKSGSNFENCLNQRGIKNKPNNLNSHGYSHSISSINEQLLQNFIIERREFENHIYMELQNENKQLKKQLAQKDNKIDLFMKMKVQDSEIILGLKEAVAKMTEMLKQKENRCEQLRIKYQKQIQKQEANMYNHKMSKSTLTAPHHQQSINSLEERKSFGSKENININNLFELQKKMNNCGSTSHLSSQKRSSMERQPSNKVLHHIPQQQNANKENLRDISKQQMSKSNIQLKVEENKGKKSQNRSGIDISKYKGMIQRLRNSYEFK